MKDIQTPAIRVLEVWNYFLTFYLAYSWQKL